MPLSVFKSKILFSKLYCNIFIYSIYTFFVSFQFFLRAPI